MKHDDFNTSRHYRTEAALILFCDEASDVSGEDRTRLVKAMWEGWREVIRIKLKAAYHCQLEEKRRQRPPGG